jgi:hypothetical protein
MSSIVEEVGTLVAENVNEILESAVGSPAAPNAQIWASLAEGGWGSISADPDNAMQLRDILEVARVSGRFPFSTPIASTLLAGRWFELSEERLAAGVVPVLQRGHQLVAPFYSLGVTVIDGDGTQVEIDPSSVESFSLLTPVAVFPEGTTPVSGKQLAELRSVFVAIAVGCADAVITRSIEWSSTREQFGQPIRSFQAVRHHLANAHIAREQAWTAAIAAAHEPNKSASWARQGFALARTAIELGIQVHGGVGYTWEVGLQHYLNETIELEAALGQGQ